MLGSLGAGRSACRTPSCRGSRPRWRWGQRPPVRA